MARRQYHLACGPGDLAPRILLCGDPGRAEKVAARFSNVRLERRNREFVTITGTHRGRPLSVLGTGIGPDNTEIAVVEISQLVKDPVLVRIGTSGSLQTRVRLGDVVITTGAVRLENTSTYFVPEGYPAVAHPEVVQALAEAAGALGLRHHVGVTASAPGFYGAQSRRVPGFEPRYKDLPRELSRLNVLNFEMEASALLTLAAVRGFRAGVACAVYAHRLRETFVDDRRKEKAESDVIRLGLAAMERL
jgi:uridine phosphorylase